MIKVLIADDEPRSRWGLKGLLIQCFDNQIEVFEAEDGLEAYELALKNKPDLLLLDIQMPRLKGLELVERLNDLKLDWIIVMITGHDEFEFARVALTLRVFDFLLKPVTPLQIAQLADRVLQELTRRKEENHLNQWTKERLVEQKEVLQETLLRDWLEAKITQKSFQDSLHYLAYQFPEHFMMHYWSMGNSQAESLVKDDYLMTQRGNLFLGLKRLVSSSMLVMEDNSKSVLVIIPYDQNPSQNTLNSWSQNLTLSLRGVPLLEVQEAKNLSQAPELYKQLILKVKDRQGTLSLVQSAKTYIDNHYTQADLSLESVADLLKINPNYLSRLLKNALGYSFINYLCKIRMDQAEKLLLDPTLRIREIADQVGYRSLNYFCRHFKELKGRSPKSFREARGQLKV